MNKYYAFSDGIETVAPPTEFLLLKKGDNTFTISGKSGKFTVTDDDIATILQEFNSRAKDMVVDYDHSTLDKENAMNGNAPASGWIATLKAVPEGIMATVKNWTDKAKQLISSGEYKYISPVIMFNPSNKSIMGIHSIGLTNHPAIHGAMPISAFNDFDAFFDTDKADSLVGDYKQYVMSIKNEIDTMQFQLHDNLKVLHDLKSQFPFKAEEIQSFTDGLFAQELKAMNDIGEQIPMIAFNDMGQMCEQNKKIMTNDNYKIWLQGMIADTQKKISEMATSGDGNNMLQQDLAILQAELENAQKAVISADSPAINPSNESGEVKLPLCDTVQTVDNLITIIMKLLENKDDSSQMGMAEHMKQKLGNTPFGKMLFAVKMEGRNQDPNSGNNVGGVPIENADMINKQELPLSDLGLTSSSTKQNVLLVMNDLAKIKTETKKVCEKLNVMKFSDILDKFDNLGDQLKLQKAVNVVDKMMASPDCKITPSMREWAVNYAKKDLKAFNDHMANAPVFFGKISDMKMSATESNRAIKPVYSDVETEISAMFGRKPEEVFKKN